MSEDPQQLLGYFQARCLESSDPEWAEGARLSAEWIALMAKPDVTEEEFATLFAQVEAPPKAPGSGWFDLWLRVRHWGWIRGFAVPDHHLWGWYPDEFTCSSVGPYAGHITIGKRYRILGEDTDRGLVRLVNNDGKTRWYPLELFERPAAPVRTWLRRDSE